MKLEQFGSVLRTRLDNGVTVVVKPTHHVPVVAVQAWVEVGSADEMRGEEGLAHLHEHMLFKGTSTHGVGQVARLIEGAGGEINAWTSLDHTVYHLVLPSGELVLGLELLADVLQNASFDPQELDREKQVVLEEIKRTRDMPARWIGDLIFESAFRTHPYRHPILGNTKSINQVGDKTIASFFQHHYGPERITLLAAGDLDPRMTMKKVRQFFDGMHPRRSNLQPRPQEPRQRKLRTRLLRDDIKESHFNLGWHIPAATHEDIPALDTLAVLLGQGESCRLNLRLKHELELVNDIYAYVHTPKDPGLFVAGGSCRAERMSSAMKQIAKQMAEVTLRPVCALELSKAKTMIESDSLFQQETVEGLARRLGYHQMLMGDPRYEERYLHRVLTLSPEDIQRVASTYLPPQNLTTVVMLPKRQAKRLNQASLSQAILDGHAEAKNNAAPRPANRSEVKTVRVRLKNGPTVIIQEDHSIALISVRAAFLGGLRHEKESNNGINHLLARMLIRGTTSWTAEDIAQEMDAMAGDMDGYAGRNTFGLRADFPSRYVDRAMPLFADCLLLSTFPEKELKLEKELIFEAIRSREDDLAGLAFDLFAATLYPSHPYRLPFLGSRQSIASIRRAHLKAYMNRNFTPDRMVLAVVGDVNSQRMLKRIQSLFGGSTSSSKQPPLPTVSLDPRPTKVRKAVRHRSRSQAHLVLGFMGTTLSSPDRYPLEILMAILTGQGGRLFVELRDRMSLAYAISGFSLEGIEPGYLAIYLGVDPNRLNQAIQAVLDQLKRVLEQPIQEEEIKRAKEYLVGTQAISLQKTSTRAAVLALDELYGLGYLSYQKYPARIQAVRLQDVQRVARKYLDPKTYCLAVVRPKTP